MGEAVSGVAAAELRGALEEAADALAHADLDRLLACEARIEHALDGLPVRSLSAPLSDALRADAEAARAALVRCRRLGISLAEFMAAGLTARGLDGYGPRREPRSAPLHSLNLTV
jgi:hypothetical protein